jgi:hypothetical protein
MKRIFLVAATFILFTAGAFAQGGFRLGVKAGTNLTKITGQSFSDGFDLSYHVGAFAEIDFNKKWGIQPEVLWSQTTTKRTNFDNLYPTIVNSATSKDEKIKLDYMAIPILLRYNVGKILTLNAGPQFGILINQDKNFLQNGQSAFKDGDFSLVGGAQLNFNFLRIYGRYNIGLKNLNDVGNQDKWTNQQIQMGIGLRF